MASIFSKIIEGSIPSIQIDETENEIAFLDIMPCAEGHTLIVPKKEVERFEDMEPQDTASLMVFLHRISKAVSSALGGVDYNLILNNGVQAGQEVMHVHFHIIPRLERTSRMFGNRKNASTEELLQTADKIRKFLS
ncbi:MAG: HIT family protein [SAR324 cluster bacterium]|jgi:histidine triad (HIT) family protein|nr:HIT family protein [SAR324 cluster bacterium]MDP7137841.1 HIT family protein [SAR324 cluster bacterium]MDP7335027.1 HIT family protein [SAR324 cluster bacterium]MDP7501688.1 HIT family protein [SAR324 cluster bacterium]HJL87823.1 HIT family protein [SAR324 cluster bacterium]|tara:strand:+ start:1952 stop:2359 length:408 start_codon:yes stop_codon:yes gene_type:complete